MRDLRISGFGSGMMSVRESWIPGVRECGSGGRRAGGLPACPSASCAAAATAAPRPPATPARTDRQPLLPRSRCARTSMWGNPFPQCALAGPLVGRAARAVARSSETLDSGIVMVIRWKGWRMKRAHNMGGGKGTGAGGRAGGQAGLAGAQRSHVALAVLLHCGEIHLLQRVALEMLDLQSVPFQQALGPIRAALSPIQGAVSPISSGPGPLCRIRVPRQLAGADFASCAAVPLQQPSPQLFASEAYRLSNFPAASPTQPA